MVAWRREMAGNWRAGVAYVDRVDRGRFSSARGSSPQEPGEERLDLSQLSAEELEVLERRYSSDNPSDANGKEDR